MQFVVVQFLLLMGNVLAFARFAQAVTFDGLRQNDGGRAAMLNGSFEGSVNFEGSCPPSRMRES